jgi:hypothetical protein
MGWPASRRDNYIQAENLKERGHMGYLGADGRIILNLMLINRV